MKLEAFKTLEAMQFQFQKLKRGICLTHPHFHQGVIGILAGRLKEQYHRPAIVFAPVEAGYLKGSARSITGIHMRDLLDLLAKRAPHIIQKFGGHAMAAGLQILPEHFEDFQNLFNAILTEYEEALFIETLLTDGELADTDLCLATIELLDSAGPFGQGFPAPCFEGIFTLIEQRIVGENHLKLLLQLSPEGKYIDAIFFGIDKNHYPNHRATRAKIAYTLDINEYNGIKKVQLMVEAMEYIS
jgi:single-stranded-DNA-specific exonuclease